MNGKILVVEDDPKMADLLVMYLEREGYAVLRAADGRTAIDEARRRRPDLVVLDLMLPEVDGLDVCRVLRAESDVAIILLTARSTESDRLLGLDLGADDYVVKPFSPREVVARVRAVLRRAGRDAIDPVLRCGDLVIDTYRHEVRRKDAPVTVTPREFAILAALAAAQGRTFTRTELLEEAFGYDYEGLERTVDVHVMNLRRKLEDDPARPRYLRTVYGVGYRMPEDPDAP